MIKRALISVYNKENLDKLVEALLNNEVKIYCSTGTADYLENLGYKVNKIEEITGFSSLLGGLVKTLHPMVFAGILADIAKGEHRKDIEEFAIEPFDIVVVNLYPFKEQVIDKELVVDEAIEWIDIGGSALIRASAKNFKNVVILIDPKDYDPIINSIMKGEEIGYQTRLKLAAKAFRFSSYYDALISQYFSQATEEFPEYLVIPLKKIKELRYGENSHQRACLYKEMFHKGINLIDAEVLQGKEMSFNNYMDIQAAYDIVAELPAVACAIIKHMNPCGVGIGSSPLDAYRKAKETDVEAAFGGVVAINYKIDKETAMEISNLFTECLIALDYTEEAIEILSKKKNLRILKISDFNSKHFGYDWRRIRGGFLIQEWDEKDGGKKEVVSKRYPSRDELEALDFAWSIVKHVKSNAIVFTLKDRTVGIGAGQMSRVDSVKVAKMKARTSLKGTVCASDAFFPFKDSITEIAEAGATAIIQPGGSIRDEEVIEEADKYNLAMVFTGRRHFKH